MNTADREAMKVSLKELMTLGRQRIRRLSRLLLDENENLAALEEMYAMLIAAEKEDSND